MAGIKVEESYSERDQKVDAKGETGDVICCGPFVYECSADYSVCEGDPVYFDLKRQAFIPAGTSADHPYASARLDHQTYFRSIWTERAFVEDQILNRLFVRWFREWRLANAKVEIADAMTPWHGHWIWPHTDDLDMLNAAQVQKLQLESNTTTLANEYARQGKNWKNRTRANPKSSSANLSIGDFNRVICVKMKLARCFERRKCYNTLVF